MTRRWNTSWFNLKQLGRFCSFYTRDTGPEWLIIRLTLSIYSLLCCTFLYNSGFSPWVFVIPSLVTSLFFLTIGIFQQYLFHPKPFHGISIVKLFVSPHLPFTWGPTLGVRPCRHTCFIVLQFKLKSRLLFSGTFRSELAN